MSIFNSAPTRKLRKNKFNLTHDKKLTTEFGQLVPVQWLPTVPGDVFELKSSAMVRFAPLVAPVMHESQVSIYHFFVPNRLLWSNWEDFITGNNWSTNNQNWENEPIHPYIAYSPHILQKGTLGDYLGLPTRQDLLNKDSGNEPKIPINPFPMAAYNFIWKDYFMDQDLDNENWTPLADGENSNYEGYLRLTPYLKNYAKDYFTSARPWPQKGPEAMLPIDGEVKLIDQFPYEAHHDVVDETKTPVGSANVEVTGGWLTTDNGNSNAIIDPSGLWEIDLSDSSIVNLRRALKLQEFLEKDSRGNRYIETVKNHFGVNSSDARLQRAEFIGSTKAPIRISEVLQTSSTDQTTPQGNMAGHGIGYGGNSKAFKYFCEEHGIIMTIMCITPRAAYHPGIARKFKHLGRFEYYWPEFAHIGEQPITKDELGIDLNHTDEIGEVWGYTPRYAEYKHELSTIHGDFKDTMDTWHLSRKWTGSIPNLNSAFLKVNQVGELNRIFAVTGPEQNLWCQVLNETKALRPMPYFGDPRL